MTTTTTYNTNWDCDSPTDNCGRNFTNTCDRSVVNNSASFQSFPLLATPLATETALLADPAYKCQVSYDGKAAGSTKAGKLTPTAGCCGTAVTFTAATAARVPAAHLEPSISTTLSCKTPAY